MKTTRRKFILTAAGGSLGALAAVPGAAAPDGAQTGGNDPGVVVIPERQVPVLAEADVVVCGGGTAGISAACCAARHGAKVVLLERWPSLGGMATNALVNIWHTSDRTKQVIFGFVQEAIERGGRLHPPLRRFSQAARDALVRPRRHAGRVLADAARTPACA